MALFSPVIRPDFNLYERKRPQPRQRTRTNTVQLAPKVAPGKESTSLDSLLDKHQKMLMLRSRRQESRCKRRSYTYLASRCPAITEIDEDENEDDTNLGMAQEFTTSTNQAAVIASIPAIQEVSDDEYQTRSIEVSDSTSSSSSRSKKKSVLSFINEWVRSRSFRKQKNAAEKGNGHF
ncbi:uncharacterized protein CELE_T24C2.5 [Caenorhabditis elegans]|uniref:Uncharacterized protein n=1 Tax=Caenorhabditis elegans TaxID=6239 RepID=Q22728_CAEEL|nr:Uncharacterized protein CELE_T24C2.5 [Caenorhabditis elegans]CAA92203.1 Uncharacterized protein CELE_T24C2.5 [Caenorhabditis elegans]|eukprot:NP_510418.1 Uncharacterized protein CELE_T24C2.5 [Caenorhabditis elegans]